MPQEANNRTPQEADNRTPEEVDNRTPEEADNRTPEEADNRTPKEADDTTWWTRRCKETIGGEAKFLGPGSEATLTLKKTCVTTQPESEQQDTCHQNQE